jgi:hypothetical protein
MLGSEFTCDRDLVKCDLVAVVISMRGSIVSNELTKPSPVANLWVSPVVLSIKKTHHPEDQRQSFPCSVRQASLAKGDARL